MLTQSAPVDVQVYLWKTMPKKTKQAARSKKNKFLPPKVKVEKQAFDRILGNLIHGQPVKRK